MTETKCFRDAFRDQLHELSGQPNIIKRSVPIDRLHNDNVVDFTSMIKTNKHFVN